MVMRQGDDKQGSRLTFSDISESGFEWVAESMKDGKATAHFVAHGGGNALTLVKKDGNNINKILFTQI